MLPIDSGVPRRRPSSCSPPHSPQVARDKAIAAGRICPRERATQRAHHAARSFSPRPAAPPPWSISALLRNRKTRGIRGEPVRRLLAAAEQSCPSGRRPVRCSLCNLCARIEHRVFHQMRSVAVSSRHHVKQWVRDVISIPGHSHSIVCCPILSC